MGTKYFMVKKDRIEAISHGKKCFLYRIRAKKPLKDVRKGDLGGYVQSHKNLSHDGDCWIFNNARAYGNAKVMNGASLRDNAEIHGYAVIKDRATMEDNASASGDTQIYEDVTISGNAIIRDKAKVYGRAIITHSASVSGSGEVTGKAFVSHDAEILGKVLAKDGVSLTIEGNTRIPPGVIVKKSPIYISGIGIYTMIAFGNWLQIGCRTKSFTQWEKELKTKALSAAGLWLSRKTFNSYVEAGRLCKKILGRKQQEE